MSIYAAKAMLREVVQWLETTLSQTEEPTSQVIDSWMKEYKPRLMEAYGMCMTHAQGEGSLASSTAEFHRAMDMGAQLMQEPGVPYDQTPFTNTWNMTGPQNWQNFNENADNGQDFFMAPSGPGYFGPQSSEWGPKWETSRNEQECQYCGDSNHRVVHCVDFRALKPQKRRSVVSKSLWCFKCLGSHLVSECYSNLKCFRCGRNHHEIMCRPRETLSGEHAVRAKGKRTRDEKLCQYCGVSNHEVDNCADFQALTHQQRRSIASKSLWCFKCLGSHLVSQCNSDVKCSRCDGKHHEVLCRPKEPLSKPLRKRPVWVKRKKPHDENLCQYCGDANHKVDNCADFKALTHRQRSSMASKSLWCFKCLGLHLVSECKSEAKCGRCGGNHHEILCRPKHPIDNNPTGDVGISVEDM